MTGHPLAIAHRGASDYAPENTLKAFQIAADLCAEMWEVDVHQSLDGVCVVSHDDNLGRATGQDLLISQSTWSQISALELPEGQHIPRLEEVVALAKTTGCGLYIEIKGKGAGLAAWRLLEQLDFRFASLGSFVVEWMAELRQLNCPYPLSVFVPAHKDPIAYLEGVAADIVHLCWEICENPHDLLTDDLMHTFAQANLGVVIWHEERVGILENLWDKPIMGICSNRPEMLKPYRPDPEHPIDIVCHRGANKLAPENTLEAARICMDQGFQFVELDVRTTSDDKLVVMHDASLKRTTSGTGAVRDLTLAEIQALDTGSWFREGAAGARVPSLAEFFDLAHGKSGIYVEIKQADAQAIIDVAKDSSMLKHCFFWSGDISLLRWLRAQSREIVLMAPRWKFASVAEAAEAYGAQIIEFDVERDDLSELEQCRTLGVRSMIYSNRSDWGEMAGYLKYRPDMVNLDHPDRFKILASYPLVRQHFMAMTRDKTNGKNERSEKAS